MTGGDQIATGSDNVICPPLKRMLGRDASQDQRPAGSDVTDGSQLSEAGAGRAGGPDTDNRFDTDVERAPPAFDQRIAREGRLTGVMA